MEMRIYIPLDFLFFISGTSWYFDRILSKHHHYSYSFINDGIDTRKHTIPYTKISEYLVFLFAKYTPSKVYATDQAYVKNS